MRSQTGRIIAVIGTAGRDREKPMTKELWTAMTADLQRRLLPVDVLVSGGAAWADHLAVHAYLKGWCQELKLFLPAPFQAAAFIGPRSSSASAANYYHQLFRQATGVNSLKEIHKAIVKGAEVNFEPSMPGYTAMFARNRKIASAANAAIAYTFGLGGQPADGGTLNTWKQIRSTDVSHVALDELLQQHQKLTEMLSDFQRSTRVLPGMPEVAPDVAPEVASDRPAG